jgi:hypothetical protein
MSLESDIFAAFESVWVSDSGKLGGVRDFLERDDPRIGGDGQVRALSPPFLICDVREVQEDSLGHDGAECEVRLTVYGRQDSGAAALRTIANQLHLKYNRQVVQSSAPAPGWAVGRPARLGGGRLAPDGTYIRRVERFLVQARYTPGAGG